MRNSSRLIIAVVMVTGISLLVAGTAFGFECKGKIGDYVWIDANADGMQDGDEVGLNDVGVTLWIKSIDTWVQYAPTTTANHPDTGEPGYYLYENLPAGDYYVAFALPADYQWTTKGGGSDNDSDADEVTGETDEFFLMCNGVDLTWDAGVVSGTPPEDEIEIEKTGGKVYGPCKTIGFWKANVDKHLNSGGQGTQVSRADLLAWLGAVRGFYLANPYQDLIPAAPEDAMLQGALDVFNYTGSDMAYKTRRQLLASELNYVSGTYAMNPPSVHAAGCREAEDLLNNGGDLSTIHDVLDYMNNLGNGSQDPDIHVGDIVGFTITVTATMGAPRTIEVTDCFDSCLSVLAVSNGGVVNGNCILWSVPLPLGASVTELNFTAMVTSMPNGDNDCEGGGGSIVSDPVVLPITSGTAGASTSSTPGFSCPPPDEDLVNCASVLPPPEEEIAIVKTGEEINGCGDIWVGDEVKYTITITSTLFAPREVEVRDYIDSCLQVLSISDGGQFVAAEGCVTWDLTLPVGNDVETVIDFTAEITGRPAGDNSCEGGEGAIVSEPVILTVLVPTDGSAGASSLGGSIACHDYVPMTNCAMVIPPGPPPPPPDEEITVVKTGEEYGGCGDIWVGEDIKYTISVTSTLNDPRDVQVRDYIDSALVVLSISDGGQFLVNEGCVMWELTLPVGVDVVTTLDFTAEVDVAPQGDNSCDGGAEGIVSDPCVLTITVPGSASAGAGVACHHYVDLANCAMVIPPPPPPPPPPPGTLEIEKSGHEIGGGGLLWVGDKIKYTINITSSLTEAYQVTVRDYFDSCLELVEADGGGSCPDSEYCVQWDLTLPPGDNQVTTMHFVVQIAERPNGDNSCDGPEGAIVSNAVLLVVYVPTGASAGAGIACHDEVDLFNCAMICTGCPDGCFKSPPPPPPPADNVFAIRKAGWKAGGRGALRVGDKLIYKITLNANMGAAGTVQVRDYLDSSLQVIGISDDGELVDGCVIWQLYLPAGESTEELYINAKVTALPNGDNGGGEEGWTTSNTVELSITKRKRSKRWNRWRRHWWRRGAGPADLPIDLGGRSPNSGTLANYASIAL